MVKEVTMYQCVCDNCGEVCTSDDICAWGDALAAKEMAMDSGWLSDNGKHYCPDCFSYDDEDNLVLKTIEK